MNLIEHNLKYTSLFFQTFNWAGGKKIDIPCRYQYVSVIPRCRWHGGFIIDVGQFLEREVQSSECHRMQVWKTGILQKSWHVSGMFNKFHEHANKVTTCKYKFTEHVYWACWDFHVNYDLHVHGIFNFSSGSKIAEMLVSLTAYSKRGNCSQHSAKGKIEAIDGRQCSILFQINFCQHQLWHKNRVLPGNQ